MNGERQTGAKPRVAVHKFASCDGCQLAFLNAGEALLDLAGRVDFVHFAEAGIVDPEAEADIAFIEGSISTPHDAERIRKIRKLSRRVITLGICATAGGVQALRNAAGDRGNWIAGIYAHPEYIDSLAESTPISAHVDVDWEVSGCPVTTRQVLAVVQDLLAGVAPRIPLDPVCTECKRAGRICVVVAKGEPCMGPVTRAGCGAVCPTTGRGCYGCFGPAGLVNPKARPDGSVSAFITGAGHE